MRFSREKAQPKPQRNSRGAFLLGRLISDSKGIPVRRNFATRKQLMSASIALAAFFACAAPLSAQNDPGPPANVPRYRQVTDETGRSVRIAQPVRRLVSLAPSVTETVYALGLQDLLVGDTDYCDYPPEARLKAKVGGAINPSLEVIAALHPDLVLMSKSLNRLDTVHALDTLGIPVYGIDPHTVSDIVSSTERLAEILGAAEAGASLASDLTRRLAELDQRLRPFGRTPVLFVVWTEPLISIGRDTFIADALQHAGAVSIVDSQQNWPQVNLEEIARLQPEFLVFAGSHSGGVISDLDALGSLPGWRLLSAVKNRRYAVISEAVNRPAPRIVSAIEDLARQLHPQAFADHPGDREKPALPSGVAPGNASASASGNANLAELQECACAL